MCVKNHLCLTSIEMPRSKRASAESAAWDPGLSGASPSPDSPHPAWSHDPSHHDCHHHHHGGSSTALSTLDQTQRHQQPEQHRRNPLVRSIGTPTQEHAAHPGQQLSQRGQKQTLNTTNICAYLTMQLFRSSRRTHSGNSVESHDRSYLRFMPEL